MKKQFIKYPSLRKFKDLKKSATSKKFIGIVEGEPQFEDNTPTLTFEGTVKMHGTHASIVYWRDGEITYQSRNRILTPENDNHGFATAMITEPTYSKIEKILECNPEIQAIMYDGEWCGGNIQSGVALSGAEKQFIVTNISEIHLDSKGECYQKFSSDILESTYPFQSVKDFETYFITVDFNDPEAYIKLMVKTLEVEANCPVGAEINPKSENKIGEGIVWTCTTKGYEDNPEWWMKVKGTKHERAGGGVKDQQQREVLSKEQEEALNKFYAEALKVDRLEQGVEYLQEMGYEISQKSTGVFLKWFCEDVIKETESEAEECYKLGLTWSGHLSKQLQRSARDFFFDTVEGK